MARFLCRGWKAAPTKARRSHKGYTQIRNRLYAFMNDRSGKGVAALELIEGPGIFLSTQVLNEVCNNLIRKAEYTELEIQQTIANFRSRYPIINVTPAIILQASLLRSSYRFSYWDSVVIATAIDASCAIVYSEDMQDGQRIGDLTIKNPLDANSRA